MGKAAAMEVLLDGGKVLLVSRSLQKLQAAKHELESKVFGADVDVVPLDAENEESVREFADSLVQRYDALVVTAAGNAAHGFVVDLPTTDARAMLESKLWTAYYCSKYLAPKLNDGGAIVLCAGILNRRPGLRCAPLAMANGALEGLTRTLALELGPRVRVNCLSPGFCDTERFDRMDPERKQAMIENTAASLPLRRVGAPSDMGKAIYYLMTAKFCTGVVLDVDGGHGIRQYANASSDPMRTNNNS